MYIHLHVLFSEFFPSSLTDLPLLHHFLKEFEYPCNVLIRSGFKDILFAHCYYEVRGYLKIKIKSCMKLV